MTTLTLPRRSPSPEPMKIVLFCHSLTSDWNHGNAHFLRGIVSELRRRGHDATAFEPADAWSRENLVEDRGQEPIERLETHYPDLAVERYCPDGFLDEPLDRALDGADLVLVHEWSPPELVAAVGERRRRGGGFHLLFHDTHHRSATAPEEMALYDLSHYDGVLAFGEVIREIYLDRGWTERAWTWHEAADTEVFRPIEGAPEAGDLVWIGNWGDDERTEELEEYLLAPVEQLGLRARIHGVRYPRVAIERLERAAIDYGGWIANFDVPALFARFRVTVHVPRRPYTRALPGIPTIRPFEALASGIPLVSAPWHDSEGLFRTGTDYLVAADGAEMERRLRQVLDDRELARELARNGRETIERRHTCAHRVDELLDVVAELDAARGRAALGEPGEEPTARRAAG